MFEIEKYSPEMRREWDAFVNEARNATFLFMRGYMDYHSDRFDDCSWIVRKNGSIVALLPANISEDGVLHSHQGLTYGGWILPHKHINGEDLLAIFQTGTDVWRSLGIKALDYKPLPYIYSARPSQEDIYALFRLGAELKECNLSSAIDLVSLRSGNPESIYNKLRRRALAKTSKLQFTIRETTDATTVMEMTERCLHDRHDAHPVHTIEEMQMLRNRFPENIHFWVVEYEGEAQASVCIYDTDEVAHTQYISTTPSGREMDLLTPLFDHLIRKVYTNRRYFDLGTSNGNHGIILNSGLLRQKASFGATGVAYPRYLLTL